MGKKKSEKIKKGIIRTTTNPNGEVKGYLQLQGKFYEESFHSLTPEAVCLYIYFAKKINMKDPIEKRYCYPSYDTIKKETPLNSDDMIKQVIEELIFDGLITNVISVRELEKKFSGVPKCPNAYFINMLDEVHEKYGSKITNDFIIDIMRMQREGRSKRENERLSRKKQEADGSYTSDDSRDTRV